MASKRTYLTFGFVGPAGLTIGAFVPREGQDASSLPDDAIMPILINASSATAARQEWRNRRAEIEYARMAEL